MALSHFLRCASPGAEVLYAVKIIARVSMFLTKKDR